MIRPVSFLYRGLVLPGLLLLLQSCASTTDEIRPKAMIDAEYKLQQGTTAFYNDEYPDAANNFTQALKIYRSIDDYSGIIDSYTNLVETTIAIGNLNLAHRQLHQIEKLLTDNNDQSYRERITLLKVKLLFIEQDYAQAMVLLQPILPGFNGQQQLQNSDANSLNILSAMARLSVTINSKDASLWLQRLQLAIQQNPQSSVRYKALLLRIQATQKQHERAYDESKNLLNKALSIYHQQAYRRGIAACLQQLAEVEELQLHWQQADNLLQRSLNIHLWTLNRRAAVKVLQQLITINSKLGHKELAQSFDEQLNKLTKQKNAN